MRVLKVHDKGVQVYFLQRLLNKAAKTSGGRLHQIREDGDFGPMETEPAVRAFQSLPGKRLKIDGIVGKNTWAALGLKFEKEHKITLIPQKTDWTCWHAAVSMILEYQGKYMSIVTSPEHMQYYLTSGLDGMDASTQLALELGWYKLNHSPDLWELIEIMKRTPVYVGYDWKQRTQVYEDNEWKTKNIEGAHAVVFGALYSDGQTDGTVIKVYDPEPRMYQLFFNNMITYGASVSPRAFLIPQ